ncbi:MAG: cysteine hydrolase family protein [Fusobacteriaceae bacterium]
MVLLVVDTQKLLVNSKLYNRETTVINIKTLIKLAHENNVEIIYVQHDGGKESRLTKGKEGFEIYEEFSPRGHEKIFIKNTGSSFRKTGLLEYLKEKNEKNIVVVGLQTDQCIDATIKCGFEHEFNMIVPSDTNSTIDNEFMTGEQSYKYYNEYVFNNYAQCISIDKVIKMMKS